MDLSPLVKSTESGQDCSVQIDGVTASVHHVGEWITLKLDGKNSFTGRRDGFLQMLSEWKSGKRGIVRFKNCHLLCHV